MDGSLRLFFLITYSEFCVPFYCGVTWHCKSFWIYLFTVLIWNIFNVFLTSCWVTRELSSLFRNSLMCSNIWNLVRLHYSDHYPPKLSGTLKKFNEWNTTFTYRCNALLLPIKSCSLICLLFFFRTIVNLSYTELHPSISSISHLWKLLFHFASCLLLLFFWHGLI